MRSMCVALLVLLACSAAPAQEMLKVNIVELFGQVPVPPADAKEAYARCDHGKDPNVVVVNETKYYLPMSEKLKGLGQKLGDITMQLDKPMVDKMKSIDQKEIEKKMKTMSRDEQIKFAMEMTKQMGLAPTAMTAESPAVTAAMEESMNLSQAVGEDMQKAGAEMQSAQKVQADREKKHKDIQDWYYTEYAKIPQLSSGEMSYPEPKALHALKLKTADKHVAVENEYLTGVRKAYQDELAKWKTRYSPMQQKLAAIHYGEDAKNAPTKKTLLGSQSMMVNAATSLLRVSSDATHGPAEWYARKVQAENEKIE